MKFALLIPLATALAVTSLTGCGPVALRSVHATGEIGAGIRTHVPAVRTANRFCEVLAANGDLEATTCVKFTQSTPDAVRAMTMLASYGGALSRIAKSSDSKLYENTSVVLGGGRDLGLIAVRDGELKAIAGAMEGLANLITQEYRRGKAVDVVKAAHEDVLKVADGLDRFLAAQEALLTQNIRSTVKLLLDNSVGRCDEKDLNRAKICLQDNLADRVVLHGFLMDVDASIAAVGGARRALTAFKSAHTRLRKDVGKIEQRDEDIYHDIVCRTSEIYFGLSGKKPAGCK